MGLAAISPCVLWGTHAYHALAGPALPTPPKPAYPGNGCYQRVSSGSRVNGPNCGPTFHIRPKPFQVRHPTLLLRDFSQFLSHPSLPNPRSRKPTVRQTPLLAVYGDKLGVTRCHSDWPLGLLGSVLPPSRSNPPRWRQPDASVVHRQRIAYLIRNSTSSSYRIGLPI